MLQRLQKERRSRVSRISKEAMAILQTYSWPGNVRELENTLQRCVVVAQGDTILRKDLPQEILEAVQSGSSSDTGEGSISTLSLPLVESVATPAMPASAVREIYDQLYEVLRLGGAENLLERAELELTKRALKETAGNQVKASAILGMTRSTLRKRIERLETLEQQGDSA
jgi:two-component system nitrogen regulation response regulator GlnG